MQGNIFRVLSHVLLLLDQIDFAMQHETSVGESLGKIVANVREISWRTTHF